MTSSDTVSCPVFCLNDETDSVVGAESLADDPFYLWFCSEPQLSVEHEPQSIQTETWHVRAVGMEESGEWIALDSGADVSLLPQRCVAGQEVQSPDLRLEDAQGNQIYPGWRHAESSG